MSTLEWVDEVTEIFVCGKNFDTAMWKVNKALSAGWRLLEVYGQHPGDAEIKGATGTVYVLGRARKRKTREE